MQIDEIAYLDQLHEAANNEGLGVSEREKIKAKFLEIVFRLWPEYSRAFDDLKHSL
jgi:hypothetical protein